MCGAQAVAESWLPISARITLRHVGLDRNGGR
jgi:hypothetical protein